MMLFLFNVQLRDKYMIHIFRGSGVARSKMWGEQQAETLKGVKNLSDLHHPRNILWQKWGGHVPPVVTPLSVQGSRPPNHAQDSDCR